MGIRGYNKADAAAKSALSCQHISSTKVPYTDSKPAINTYIKQRWQSRWDDQQFNKLKTIKPILCPQPLTDFSRQEAVKIRRCRIGHTHLTHSFLLKGEDPPICIPCQCPLTVKHILLECADTGLIRETFYSAFSMQYLFNHVSGNKILDFLREIKLFDKL